MIVGEIEPDNRPVLSGLVSLPKVGGAGLVRFLVDTGPDRTTLHPGDAELLGVDFQQLGCPDRFDGVGGSAKYFPAEAELRFWDDAEPSGVIYRLAIAIAEPTEYNIEYPSLLGRDVLVFWAMEYVPGRRTVRFTILQDELGSPS